MITKDGGEGAAAQDSVGCRVARGCGRRMATGWSVGCHEKLVPADTGASNKQTRHPEAETLDRLRNEPFVLPCSLNPFWNHRVKEVLLLFPKLRHI